MEYHSLELNWTIKAESLNIPHGQFVSTELIPTTLPNLSYQIYFYPNGKQQQPQQQLFPPPLPPPHQLQQPQQQQQQQPQPQPTNGPFIVLYTKTNVAVEVKVCIRIPSANNLFRMDSVITKFHDTLLYGTGLTLPINVKLLDEVVKTKKLTFQFRGTLKKQQIKRRLPFEDNPLREILWNDSGKDLTLVIENKEIKVHKFLMATRSSYFQAMINSPWIENVENQTIVQEFSFEVTEKAVKFIYDFPLVFSSMEDALDLLNFGEYYNVADLKIEAEKYLIAQINANTVCALANASMKCNSQNLRLLCLNYLLKCQKTSFPIFGLETLDPEFNNELTKRIFCVIQSS